MNFFSIEEMLWKYGINQLSQPAIATYSVLSDHIFFVINRMVLLNNSRGQMNDGFKYKLRVTAILKVQSQSLSFADNDSIAHWCILDIMTRTKVMCANFEMTFKHWKIMRKTTRATRTLVLVVLLPALAPLNSALFRNDDKTWYPKYNTARAIMTL